MKNYKFEELNKDLQEQIKDTLQAYDEVTVYYENGAYHFGNVIKSHYADDKEFIGVYYADEVFTPEEKICNYISCFHSFPITYKGHRDYGMFEEMRSHRRNGKECIIKLVDGNAVIDKIVPRKEW